MSKKLSHELGKIFERELEKILQKEINDPDYMNRSQFEGELLPDYARMKAIIDKALPAVYNVGGIAAAKHEKDTHEGDTQPEIDVLSAQTDDADVSIGLLAWWKH